MAEESRRSVARGDLVTGLILLGATAVGAWSLLGNETLRGFDYGADPGPGLVPSLLLILLGVCAAALALRGLMGVWRRVPGPEPEDPPGAGRILYPALLVATLCLYALGMPAVGFLPATLVLTCLWSILISRQEAGGLTIRSTVSSIVEAFAITAAVYVVFAWFIKVPLP